MQYVFQDSFEFEGTFTMNTSQNYQEILKLEKLLIMAGIPHVKTQLFDGWKILYLGDNEGESDVIEHIWSYGHEEDLLELSGCGIDVIGRISAVEVFILWSEDYRKRDTSDYRIDNYMKTWKEIIRDKNFYSAPVSDESFELLAGGCYLARRNDCNQVDVADLDYYNGANLLSLSVIAVIDGDTEFIEALLEYQTRKRFVWYILDMLIQCAIDRKESEIQIMLVDYKYRNDLFRKKQFEL